MFDSVVSLAMKNTAAAGCFAIFVKFCVFLELHLCLLSLWIFYFAKKSCFCDFSIDFCYQVFKTLQIKFHNRLILNLSENASQKI